MPRIETEIIIDAPIERCFDLARSVDLHIISTSQTKEYIIDGRKNGLIQKGETVTWRAKHFGIWQNLTSIISALDTPTYFCDEMVKGAFHSFKHEHFFEEQGDGKTIMRDVFDFQSPLGLIGKVFNYLILTDYMTSFLQERNEVIKHFAETDKWKEVLKSINS